MLPNYPHGEPEPSAPDPNVEILPTPAEEQLFAHYSRQNFYLACLLLAAGLFLLVAGAGAFLLWLRP